MKFLCKRSQLRGKVEIPGSKSHTVRAVAIAAMASGESVVEMPLVSADTLSAMHAATMLGAEVDMHPGEWRVCGCAGKPVLRADVIDVGNSGTTLRVVMGMACHLEKGHVVLTGDEQIQRRPSGPLANALNDLGARVVSLGDNGCAPFTVSGPLVGGQTTVEGRTSQYVTSLLLACPLAGRDSMINVPLLNEQAYVQMTLDWLKLQKIRVENEAMRRFHVEGGQRFTAFRRRMPADFSTATFFLGAGALANNQITCLGLDMADSQADKAVIDYLQAMGARVDIAENRVDVCADQLQGIEIDMNETPDALPMMAVLGCFADGETRLRNVAHARIKETDRIAVMCGELRKMGADVEELPDGLIVRQSNLHGTTVDGHRDHRVVMALALAGMHCDGETVVGTAEAAAVTFPDFAKLMTSLNGRIRPIE